MGHLDLVLGGVSTLSIGLDGVGDLSFSGGVGNLGRGVGFGGGLVAGDGEGLVAEDVVITLLVSSVWFLIVSISL